MAVYVSWHVYFWYFIFIVTVGNGIFHDIYNWFLNIRIPVQVFFFPLHHKSLYPFQSVLLVSKFNLFTFIVPS